MLGNRVLAKPLLQRPRPGYHPVPRHRGGDLAGRLAGDTIRPASWPESRATSCVPPARTNRCHRRAFSQAHYDHVVEKFGDPAQLDRYQTFFLDSITQLSRQCFAWSKTQPGATSDRSGKPDLPERLRVVWPGNDQRIDPPAARPGQNVVFVAILDETAR